MWGNTPVRIADMLIYLFIYLFIMIHATGKYHCDCEEVKRWKNTIAVVKSVNAQSFVVCEYYPVDI